MLNPSTSTIPVSTCPSSDNPSASSSSTEPLSAIRTACAGTPASSAMRAWACNMRYSPCTGMKLRGLTVSIMVRRSAADA